MELETITLVKPETYEQMNEETAKHYLKAQLTDVPKLEKLVKLGEEQIKSMPGYTDDNLPNESPVVTNFSLDGIDFDVRTSVRVNNPRYETAFQQIKGFLEVLINDWGREARKYGIRTYDGKPFVRWDYLMENVLWYLSGVTDLGIKNDISNISLPKELENITLDRLVLPLHGEFDISKPGNAKLWYLTTLFYKDLREILIEPVKEEMDKRSGLTKEEIPDETKVYWEQFGRFVLGVKSTPSPRSEPGDVIKMLFAIPQKDKPKGSKALPIIPNQDNYIELLETYKELLPTSLKRWKELKGKIGEVVVFYYGIEKQERIQQELTSLHEYQVRRDGDQIFISVLGLYNRMIALVEDSKKNRLLRKYEALHLL